MKTAGGLRRKYTYLNPDEERFLTERCREAGVSESAFLRRLLNEQMQESPAPDPIDLDQDYVAYVRHRAVELDMTPAEYLEALITREMEERPPTRLEVQSALVNVGDLGPAKVDAILDRIFRRRDIDSKAS